MLSALQQEQILVVLDDFEQNLGTGGDAFRDAATAGYVAALARAAQRGRLLLTSRFPVPDLDSFFRRIAVGPLSLSETRKLLLRLEGLGSLNSPTLTVMFARSAVTRGSWNSWTPFCGTARAAFPR